MNKVTSIEMSEMSHFSTHLLTMSLFSMFNATLVPFTDIAREIFGWKHKKTAESKIEDLMAEGLTFVQFELTENKKKHFVLVEDLAKFIISKRTVTISSLEKMPPWNKV